MYKKYIIISPLRNEGKYIEKTIVSVIAQNIQPQEWIIVNDGSTDKSPKIVEKYLAGYSWIKLVNLPDRCGYKPGKGIVEVFNKGFELISSFDWEFVVKLDCDLEFEADYFERVLKEFKKNDKLGIASGAMFLLTKKQRYVLEKNQEDHPWGASKVYRRECFEAIGGLKPIPGWDLADILSAQMDGWETKCFNDLKVVHFKLTGGLRKGFTRGKFLLGKLQYRFGYTFYYTFLKAVYRLTERPCVIGSLGIVFGYLFAWINQEKKIFSPEMVFFLRMKQTKFLRKKMREIFQIWIYQ